MVKPNPLQAALDRIEPSAEAVTPNLTESVSQTVPKSKSSRSGTVLVGGHFPPYVKQQLRILAAEENTTSQALIEEALDLLFVKKGKAAIRF